MLETYIGRFAPTPSGGLHLGSLVTALASYLDAKSHNGKWLLRIEDVDLAREVPGASNQIIRTLETYGFEWDGDIIYQHNRMTDYQAIADQLFNQGFCYACICSRKKLLDYAIYPGFCQAALKPAVDAAIRVRVPNLMIHFNDRVQGKYHQHLAREVGDFIIKRSDGLFAYQLAVVLDDAMQGITDVVRGVDLLDSTPRQIYLQELLGLSPVKYLHVPLLVDCSGKKLSKSMGAKQLSDNSCANLLVKALGLLGQKTDQAMLEAKPAQILQWAIDHWQVGAIPKLTHLTVDTRINESHLSQKDRF